MAVASPSCSSIRCLLGWAVVLAVGLGAAVVGPAWAADPLIVDAEGDVANKRTVLVGYDRELYLDAAGCGSVTVAWSSSDPTVAVVSGDASGVVVRGVSEGTAVVRVDGRCDGAGFFDEAVMLVATALPGDVRGSLSRDATLWWTTRREDGDRHAGSRGLEVNVRGTCGGFYLLRMPDDFVWDDGRDGASFYFAVVEKSAVNIPVSAITVAPEAVSPQVGQSIGLSAGFNPVTSLTLGASFSWSGGNASIASVTAAGVVVGRAEGATIVTVSSRDFFGRALSGQARVSVWSAASASGTTTRATQILDAAMASAAQVASVSIGATVAITGTCGSFFRVTTGGKTGFVTKSAVHVPVTSVAVEPTSVEVAAKETARLEVRVSPPLATDQKVTWKVVKGAKRVRVSSNGTVRGLKVGDAVVEALSEDGPKSTVTVKVVDRGPRPQGVAEPESMPSIVSISTTVEGHHVVLIRPAAGYKCLGLWVKYPDEKGWPKAPDNVWTEAAETTSRQVDLKAEHLGRTVSYYAGAWPYPTCAKSKATGQDLLRSPQKSAVAGEVGLSAKVKMRRGDKIVRLDWTTALGAGGYRIERQVEGGKWELVKSMERESDNAWVDSGPPSAKELRYRVAPVNAKGKTLTKAMSHPQRVGPLYLKQSSRKAAQKEAGKRINDLFASILTNPRELSGQTVAARDAGVAAILPFVQYVWRDTCTGLPGYKGPCLEIRLHITFENGGWPQDQALADDLSRHAPPDLDAYFRTRRKWFSDGIKKGYNNIRVVSERGDSSNFFRELDGTNLSGLSKRLEFRTYLNIFSHNHLKIPEGQSVLHVQIGGQPCRNNADMKLWYKYCLGPTLGYYATQSDVGKKVARIYVPWEEALADRIVDTKYTEAGNKDTKSAYGATAAHEFGHALGLADAYSDCDSAVGCDRMDENSETARDLGVKAKAMERYVNVMKHDSNQDKVIANDVEMMLFTAYHAAANKGDWLNSRQAYKKYREWKGPNNKKENRLVKRSRAIASDEKEDFE